MGALGDFFQGAYAYSEQERLRQVEEDNKFKLYEKQQRLVNSLADEDRKTQVVEWEPRPDEGIVVGLNANGDVVTTRPMDKIAQQTARSAGAKAETDQARSALDLFLEEQYGAGQRAASINATNAQAEATRKYGDAAGRRATEDDTPQLTPGQKDAIGKEAYELESALRVGLADFLEMNQGALHSNNKAAREAAPGRSGEAEAIKTRLQAVMSMDDPVQRRNALRDLKARALELRLITE